MSKLFFNHECILKKDEDIFNLFKTDNIKDVRFHLNNIPFIICFGCFEKFYVDVRLRLDEYIDKFDFHHDIFTYRNLFDYVLQDIPGENKYNNIGLNFDECYEIYQDQAKDIADMLVSLSEECKNNICTKLVKLSEQFKNDSNEEATIRIINQLIDYRYYLGKLLLAELYINSKKYHDIPTAIKLCKEAINDGVTLGYNDLGLIFEYQEDYRDIDKAYECYKKAIESKEGLTYFNFARLNCEYDEHFDLDIAIKYFNMAIDEGFETANINLGRLYMLYDYCLDYEKALSLFEKVEDHPVALNNIGYIYLNCGEYKNEELAYQYFLSAYKKGSELATYNLAYMHSSIKAYFNIEIALKYYNEFLSYEHYFFNKEELIQFAYNNLGYLYYENKEIFNLDKAIEYFNLSNIANSYSGLAKIYCYERPNFTLAIKAAIKLLDFDIEYISETFIEIFKSFNSLYVHEYMDVINQLEEINTAKSYTVIGDLYKLESSLLYNPNKSFKSYQKAIKLDSAYEGGYRGLGYCYLYGLGVLKDLNKAKENFSLCQIHFGCCGETLKMVEALLSKDDKDNQIAKEFNGDFTIFKARTILDKAYNNVHVNKAVKTSLLTGLVEYVNIVNSEKDLGINLDYSTVIMNFYKALENMIRINLIDKYRNYLKSNINPQLLSNNKYLTYLSEIGTYEYRTKGEFDHFVLSDFKKLTGIKHNADNTFVSAMKLNNSDSIKIDEPLLIYLNKIFFNYQKEEIKNYIVLLSNFIDTTNGEFRNAAVHYKTMSKNDAEFVINSFLFTRKIITDFYFKMEGIRND